MFGQRNGELVETTEEELIEMRRAAQDWGAGVGVVVNIERGGVDPAIWVDDQTEDETEDDDTPMDDPAARPNAPALGVVEGTPVELGYTGCNWTQTTDPRTYNTTYNYPEGFTPRAYPNADGQFYVVFVGDVTDTTVRVLHDENRTNPLDGCELDIGKNLTVVGHYGPNQRNTLDRLIREGWLVGWHQNNGHYITKYEVLKKIDRWQEGVVWRKPFIYAPKFIHQDGKVWALDDADVRKLRRENCELRYIPNTAHQGHASNAVLIDLSTGKPLNHFHRGCWGHDGFEGRANEDEQGIIPIEEYQARFEVINVDSLNAYEFAGVKYGALLTRAQRNKPVTAQWAAASRTLRHIGLGLQVPKSIVILGAGGVGFHVAAMAATVGIEHICLIDHDRLAEHNRNRLYVPSTNGTRGDFKTNSVEKFIKGYMGDEAPRMRKWMNMAAHEAEVPNEVPEEVRERHRQAHVHIPTLEEYRLTQAGRVGCTEQHDAIMDCTDNLDAQHEAWRLAQKHNWRYIRAGYDGGHHVTITGRQAPEWDLKPGETYTTPSWIAGAQMAASLALVKLVSEPDMDMTFDIRKMEKE